MSYICKNYKCSAPENKKDKVYPSAMECPFCDEQLVEVISLSENELELLNKLPYVIAYPLRKTLVEKHAWTKINLLKDTFLNYLKYLGLITASEFFNSPFQDKKMVVLFYNTLSEPSFGTWNVFIRETLKFLREKDHQFFCPELHAYYEQVETGKKRKMYKGEIQFIDAYGDVQYKIQEATAIGMLINFRNRYLGHGLTLDEATSIKLWEQYYPIFSKLLNELSFTLDYIMYKHENGETYSLNSAEIKMVETISSAHNNVWLQNKAGDVLEILPFFIVPGEVNLANNDKEQIFTYESYTGKTIKFFSPEGTEKQTSGKILERLNLLLRNKQKEQPYTPETFSREVFLSRIVDENKIILDTLVAEKKIIPGVYVHRDEMEIKLREWVGARASIFFISAEAGSGKTNLLMEMQRQYAEWGLNSLFIRAGRMEKPNLSEQIAYLLNIDSVLGLSNYPAIAGTQAAPTLFLIDGLNEAFNSEHLWKEVLVLCQLFEPGSVKFVLTSRANNSSDLLRYSVSDHELNLVYGKKMEQQEGMPALAFWLSALNMEELKAAWDNYAVSDKLRYKPLFSFDDIATFDRSIYDQINNPLILRIFLEVYNKKNLPHKAKQHLNIWHDWLQTFTNEEQRFLRLLASEIWTKGENELLLDDLLKIKVLKNYLVNDNLNSPYQRLRNLGWVSRYIKDLNVCIGFTVEGLLVHMLGMQLQSQSTEVNVHYIKEIHQKNNKLQKSGLESYLTDVALKGDIDLISELIDMGEDQIEVCIRPLVHLMKSIGVEKTLDKLLENSTDKDWMAISKLLDYLDKLQLINLKKEVSRKLFLKANQLEVDLSLNLSISILESLKYPQNEILIKLINNKIKDSSKIKRKDLVEIQKKIAFYYTFNGFPNRAIEIYETLFNFDELNEPNIINKIAAAYDGNNLKDVAIFLYKKALRFINEKTESNLKLLSMLYFNLAKYQENETQKLEYYEKALLLELKIHGQIHTDTARTIAAIGLEYINQNNYKEAYIKLKSALDITNKLNVKIGEIDDYLGLYYEKMGDLDKSLYHYEASLLNTINKLGNKNKNLLEKFTQMGRVLERIGDDLKSITFFKRAEEIAEKSEDVSSDSVFYIKHNIGYLKFMLGEYQEAIKYLNSAKDIHNKDKTNINEVNIRTTYFYLGYSYFYLSEYKLAINALNDLSLLTIDQITLTEFIENNELIGNCHFYLENFHESASAYKKLLPYLDDQNKIIEITKLIGACYENLNQFENALNIYSECMRLQINEKSDLEYLYFRIGICCFKLRLHKEVIKNISICINMSNKSTYSMIIAESYEEIGDIENALQYFIKSSELSKEDPDEGVESELTKLSIENAKRLAKKINKEIYLPEWIRNF